MSDDGSFNEWIRRQGPDAGRIDDRCESIEPPPHPDHDLLAAYRVGALDAEDAERFREHLLECPACVDLLLISGGGDPPLEDEGVAGSGDADLDFRKDETWSRIRREIDADSLRSDLDTARARLATALRRRRTERYGWLAAVLLISLPLFGWGLQGQAKSERLLQPWINVEALDISLGTRRGAAAESAVSPDVDAFTVSFRVDAPRAVGSDDSGDLDHGLRVELATVDGDVLWRGEDLEVDRFGYARIALSRAFLERVAPGGGEVRVRVRVFTAHGAEPVADYPLRLGGE